MTNREKQMFFETLELLRETVRNSRDFEEADWKDVDDYIFSRLCLTVGDLYEIYHDRSTLIYMASAIEGFHPAAPTFSELASWSGMPLVCCETEVGSMGNMACVKAGSAQSDNIILTEADAANVADFIGDAAYIVVTAANDNRPRKASIYAIRGSDANGTLLYSVLENTTG